MDSGGIESIPSFVALTDTLATAGQPSEAQLAAVAAAGFDVVINLALHDDPAYSLKDEAGLAASLGLEYVHIPVQFAAPTLEALAAFSAAMQRAGEGKVFVHCRHNKRVPVFIALDRVLRQGWPRDEALAAMRQVWVPDANWQAFIERALVPSRTARMRWTHVTLPLSNLDASIAFFTDVCGLHVVRDRRKEGGRTVWLGPPPAPGTPPVFVMVAFEGEVKEPLDHLGFQCDSREEVTRLAELLREQGQLVSGPTDAGGSVGYYAIGREPSGHLVEFTFGQPLAGLGAE